MAASEHKHFYYKITDQEVQDAIKQCKDPICFFEELVVTPNFVQGGYDVSRTKYLLTDLEESKETKEDNPDNLFCSISINRYPLSPEKWIEVCQYYMGVSDEAKWYYAYMTSTTPLPEDVAIPTPHRIDIICYYEPFYYGDYEIKDLQPLSQEVALRPATESPLYEKE